MNTGAITGYFDVAQIVLYTFWIFFAGLVIYLHRENKREGYPLESDRSSSITVQGFPAVPPPKTYHLADGSTVQLPRPETDTRKVLAEPIGRYPGAPLAPTGDGMRDAVGPAAYALRATHPDRALDGKPLIQPMRRASEFSVASEDPDPRGMPVYGADGERGGTVSDVWVDRAEYLIRYLEVQTGAGRHVLLPMTLAKVDGRGYVRVKSILGSQFEHVPAHANPDEVTLREEDQISAYYGGGTLYATGARAEPLL